MSLKSMSDKMTSTTSTKKLEEVQKEEFVRSKINSERKLEIQEIIRNPKKVSPTVKTLLSEEEPSIIPSISKEIIVDRRHIFAAPEEWNFFGRPNKESYELLMSSILTEGLMNPITLWKQKDGRYMILSGHTRDSVYDDLFQATSDSKWLSIPAKYYDVDDITENDARRIIILANMAQRAKESPRIRIRCYGEYAKLTKARASYGSGIDVSAVVADTFGINRATVFFYRRLNNLIDPILDRFCNGRLTRNNANILCGLSVELQKYLVETGYVDIFDKDQFQKLRKATTTQDIDAAFLNRDNAPKKRRYTVNLKIDKPDNANVWGLCLPREKERDCYDIIRNAFKNSSLDEKTKEFILSQLISGTD